MLHGVGRTIKLTRTMREAAATGWIFSKQCYGLHVTAMFNSLSIRFALNDLMRQVAVYQEYMHKLPARSVQELKREGPSVGNVSADCEVRVLILLYSALEPPRELAQAWTMWNRVRRTRSAVSRKIEPVAYAQVCQVNICQEKCLKNDFWLLARQGSAGACILTNGRSG